MNNSSEEKLIHQLTYIGSDGDNYFTDSPPEDVMDNVLDDKERQINTEDEQESHKPKYQYCEELVSWLQFNARVLNEARRSINPIMERLNFIGIADSNLDEFIRTKFVTNKSLKRKIVDQTKLIEETFDQLKEELLTEYNIDFSNMEFIKQHKDAYFYLRNEFKKKIFPLIQPLILKKELPIPDIDDGGTFIISKLESDDPKGITGIIRLPDIELMKVKHMPHHDTYITNEEVILEFIGNFYRGKNILWNKIFKVYRRIDSLNINMDSNYIDGIRSQLHKRTKAEIVMVDINTNIDGIESILGNAKKRRRKYVGGLKYLSSLKDVVSYTDSMVFNKAKPRTPIAFSNGISVFDTLTKTDVMVHFPYESFEKSTIRFLEEAANDPDVLCIKQTLYRVSKNSRLTKALITAAKSGKQVVVLLELKAKMDEWNNLRLADQLKKAGCHIIFGPTNMKTHAKTILVIRREGDKLAKYINISTGNFNEKTAKIYEDISYFTKERKRFKIGEDLCELFNHLGGYNELSTTNKLLIAPVNFRERIIEEIDNCIKSPNSTIVMKMNSLTDKDIVKKLYDASNAGVEIKLIVRGMCILIPGIEGMSENIEVISIVGRYLEHSRIYEFVYTDDNKNDAHNIYIGSGDIMPRNLDHRIEVILPITDFYFKTRLQTLLENYFIDTKNKYIMNSDGTYSYPSDNEAEKSFSIQNDLIKYYKKIEKAILK